MIIVKLLKNHAGKKRGEIHLVKKNEAHTLIENGVATLNVKRKRRTYKRRTYRDKMMRSRR